MWSCVKCFCFCFILCVIGSVPLFAVADDEITVGKSEYLPSVILPPIWEDNHINSLSFIQIQDEFQLQLSDDSDDNNGDTLLLTKQIFYDDISSDDDLVVSKSIPTEDSNSDPKYDSYPHYNGLSLIAIVPKVELDATKADDDDDEMDDESDRQCYNETFDDWMFIDDCLAFDNCHINDRSLERYNLRKRMRKQRYKVKKDTFRLLRKLFSDGFESESDSDDSDTDNESETVNESMSGSIAMTKCCNDKLASLPTIDDSKLHPSLRPKRINSFLIILVIVFILIV